MGCAPYLHGHQYRPANRLLAANTIDTARERVSHLAKQKQGTNPTAKPLLALNVATTQDPTSSNFKESNPSKANKKANELKIKQATEENKIFQSHPQAAKTNVICPEQGHRDWSQASASKGGKYE